MAIYDRTCIRCSRSFQGGPRAWYCPDCRKERQRERCDEDKRDDVAFRDAIGRTQKMILSPSPLMGYPK